MSIDYSNMAFPKGQNIVKKKKAKDISKTNREKTKELFKGKCGLCKQRVGAHIHHIAYKSEDKSKIDDLENLILLCIECHEKVHSNKEEWQPKLKEIRKKLNSK